MSERPLWKRIGVHQNSNKTDCSGRRSSQNNQSVQSMSPIRRNQQSNRLSQPIINFNIEEVDKEISNEAGNHQLEERIFHECFSKFKQVSKQQKEGSNGTPKVRGDGSSGVSPEHSFSHLELPHDINDIAAQKRSERHNKDDQKTNVLKNYKRIDGIMDVLSTLKEGFATIKRTLTKEKAELYKNIACIEGHIKAFNINQHKTTQHNESTQTNNQNGHLNVKPQHQMDTSRENIDCMFSTRPISSILRKDMYLSHVKFEAQHFRDVNAMEACSLKQKIELLTLKNKMLEQQIVTIRSQQEQTHKVTSKLHIQEIEKLYDNNTSLLRETIEKNIRDSFQKDNIISNLKSSLNHKTEQIVILQQKIKQASMLKETHNNNAIYIRKYKDMYEACEQQKFKIIAQNQSHQQQISDLKQQLEKLKAQSMEFLEENMFLRKKLEDTNLLHMDVSNQYRRYSKEFKLKITEHQNLIHDLKQDINRKGLSIEFLNQKLAEITNQNQGHQTVEQEELPPLNTRNKILSQKTIDKYIESHDINPKKAAQHIKNIRDRPTESNSNIRSIVQRNDYLQRQEDNKYTQSKIREQPSQQKFATLARSSFDQSIKSKQKIDLLRKSYRSSARVQTEQTHAIYNRNDTSISEHLIGLSLNKIHSKTQSTAELGELSTRIESLKNMMKCEIQTNFRRNMG